MEINWLALFDSLPYLPRFAYRACLAHIKLVPRERMARAAREREQEIKTKTTLDNNKTAARVANAAEACNHAKHSKTIQK